jgi:putative Ca2+/H+ antiporter (TMEM165/GDT1 family)
MDLKLMATAFATVFLAEMGDKTQLTALALASGTRSKLSVFIGAAVALVTTTALAIVVAEAASRAVSPVWMRRAAGTLMIAIGAFYLFGAGKDAL